MNVQIIIRQPFSVSSEQIESFAHHKTRQVLARFSENIQGVQIRLDRSSMREGRVDCLCSIAIECTRGKRTVLHCVNKTPFAAISEVLKAGKRSMTKDNRKKNHGRRGEVRNQQRAA
jgi:hypothetical protein